MDFKTPYLLALAERDPKLFMELRRSGQMDDHLRQKQLQANELKELLLAQYPHPSMAEVREAEEQVFATLIDFPSAEDEEESPGRPDHLSLAGEGFPLTEDDFRGDSRYCEASEISAGDDDSSRTPVFGSIVVGAGTASL